MLKITKRENYEDEYGTHELIEFENGIKSDSIITPSQKYLDEVLAPIKKEIDLINAKKEKDAKIQAKIRKFAEGLPE